MRLIDADALTEKMPTVMDMQDTYLPIHFKEWLIDEAPTIEAVPKDFHDKTCEAMAERHTEEIQKLMPKRGEWIGEADGYYNGELIYDTWYCSNCDYVVDDEEPPTWNFCPNCGADMRKEGE